MAAPVPRRLRLPPKQPQKRLGVPVSNLEVRPPAAVPLHRRRHPTPCRLAVFAAPRSQARPHLIERNRLHMGACPHLSHAPSSPAPEYPPRRSCAQNAPRPLSDARPIDATLAPSAYMASAPRSMTRTSRSGGCHRARIGACSPRNGRSACLGSARCASGWSRSGDISCRVGMRVVPPFSCPFNALDWTKYTPSAHVWRRADVADCGRLSSLTHLAPLISLLAQNRPFAIFSATARLAIFGRIRRPPRARSGALLRPHIRRKRRLAGGRWRGAGRFGSFRIR